MCAHFSDCRRVAICTALGRLFYFLDGVNATVESVDCFVDCAELALAEKTSFVELDSVSVSGGCTKRNTRFRSAVSVSGREWVDGDTGIDFWSSGARGRGRLAPARRLRQTARSDARSSWSERRGRNARIVDASVEEGELAEASGADRRAGRARLRVGVLAASALADRRLGEDAATSTSHF